MTKVEYNDEIMTELESDDEFEDSELLDDEFELDEIDYDPYEIGEPVDGVNVCMGRIVNTSLVNVREFPSSVSEAITFLKRNDIVEVLVDDSTDEFYHIITPTGVEGYCMRKFVNL